MGTVIPFWHTVRYLLAVLMLGLVPLLSACDGSDETSGKNEVVVLGMIHDGFLSSKRYSLDTLRTLIREIDPDYVLAEIPPNRLEAALTGFRETGEVTEPRVSVFPEYRDVLIPLTREMDFEIIGVAAWTREMADYRSKMRRELRNDPAMAHAWDEYEKADEQFVEDLAGRGDDPRFIHTPEYDEITRRAVAPGEYYFNDALGPGGWRNINEAHMALISRALDRHQREGKRVLVMFGASHKYWFLDELKKRDDIVMLDPLEFIGRVAPN